MGKLCLAFLFLTFKLTNLSGQTPSFITDSLDNYIRQGMKDYNVPGLAVVVVKDGKIVVMKGYGVRDTASKLPVDQHTLFMIASNTKLFTAVSLSQLAYDKKISLDDRFIKYFPDFSLYETTSTKLLTIRDLLCHRIGTKTFQGDFTFWNSRLSSVEIMKRMKLLKPEGDFRSHYGYCNSCFMAAGQIIPRVTGKTWEAYITDSLLTPLAMRETYTGVKQIPDSNLLSKAYTTSFIGVLHQVPWDNWSNLAPAAALISNVSDLSHWLLFQLDSGRYNGKQIVPFEVLQQTRDIQTMISSRKSGLVPTHLTGYGLGLQIADYNGRQVYWHGGGAAGMVTNVCFMPEERLGIAVLTNNDNQNLYGAIRTQVLDAYTGLAYKNRSSLYLTDFNKNMADTLKTIHAWQARVRDNPTVLPLTAYTGHYLNELYGSLDIKTSTNAKQLRVVFNSHDHLSATLAYMDNNEWLLQYDNIEYGIFSVHFSLQGSKVVALETRQSDYVEEDPYRFVKQQAGQANK